MTENTKLVKQYYEKAIAKAREVLPLDVPLIIFLWNYEFETFSSSTYSDYSKYGKIIFDTHLYTDGGPDVQSVACKWEQ